MLEHNPACEITVRTTAYTVGDSAEDRPCCSRRKAARILVATPCGTYSRSETGFEAPAPARAIAPGRNHGCGEVEWRAFQACPLCGAFQNEVHRGCGLAVARQHDFLIEAPLEFVR
jgi:hypothetical protein